MEPTVSLSPLKCPWCDYQHARINSLRIHATKQHQRSAQETYDALFHPNGRPTCKCGCGQETTFFSVSYGYQGYLRGHIARVRNNWGHNEKAHIKSVTKRREMWNKGELHQWNSGLTADTDERVRANTEGFQEWLSQHPEERETRSKRMRKGRLDGTVPTLRGPDHPNWKGGLSSINQLAHSILFNAWSRPKMVVSGWCCSRCQADRDLCVHHDRERFSDLLREAAAQVGYDGLVHDGDFAKKSEVAQRLVDIHLERDVSGIVLCRECHALEHERLGEASEVAVIRSGAS